MRLARGEGLREAREPGPRDGRKVTVANLLQVLLPPWPDVKLKELGAVLRVHPSVHYVCRKWRLSRKKLRAGNVTRGGDATTSACVNVTVVAVDPSSTSTIVI